MYRLLETFKISQGVLQNINFHNERFNRSRLELFGIEEPLQLENEIQLPENIGFDTFKCRIIYMKNIIRVEIKPYQIRKINTLRIVHDNSIYYEYKYENRERLNRLFLQKGNQDDIIIISNGLVTDTSFCNIVFSDGYKLITPSTPLLKGTKREKLLREGIIVEDEIKHTNIYLFKKVFLINAMIDLEDNFEISTDKIF